MGRTDTLNHQVIQSMNMLFLNHISFIQSFGFLHPHFYSFQHTSPTHVLLGLHLVFFFFSGGGSWDLFLLLFLYNVKGYTPFIVTTKCGLHSLCVQYIPEPVSHQSCAPTPPLPNVFPPGFPVPTVATGKLSVSVSLFLFCYSHKVCCTLQIPHLSHITLYFSLTYLTQHNVFRAHPGCYQWQNSILFFTVFHCIYATFSLPMYLLMDIYVVSIS